MKARLVHHNIHVLDLDAVTVHPGFAIMGFPASAGLATSGTSKVIKIDSGSNTVPYAFAAFGNDV